MVPYLCISLFWFLLKFPLALYRGQFTNYVVDAFYDIMILSIEDGVCCQRREIRPPGRLALVSRIGFDERMER